MKSEGSMKTAEQGKTVTIQFSILLENGANAGGPANKTPLTFTLGKGEVFRKLEEGIRGMAMQENRKIPISPADGYGEYNQELVLRVERKHFAPDIKLIPGRTVQYQNSAGERVNFVVNAVDEKTVTIDGNHPLAGLNLLYDVDLLAVR
jgi:peptidylprolyl isomerase